MILIGYKQAKDCISNIKIKEQLPDKKDQLKFDRKEETKEKNQ